MMTSWDDIVGYTCTQCGHWATHWYGETPICCDCHTGEVGADTYMAQQAIEMNTKFQKGYPLNNIITTTPLIIDLDEDVCDEINPERSSGHIVLTNGSEIDLCKTASKDKWISTFPWEKWLDDGQLY